MPDYRRLMVPGGIYFLTVVTKNRFPYFQNSGACEILKQSWLKTMKEMPFHNLASVLLPDHFHCLWILPPGDTKFSKRIGRIKSRFTIAWLRQDGFESVVSESNSKHGNRGIWQRRFWEHLIRDEKDLESHFDYIHYNPVKHGYVSQSIDWKYSTFMNYVESGHYDSTWGTTVPESIRHLDVE
ncbi:MAG: REP-associated tyrosine transposase [Pirellulaceae bacterium]|jgi:putative transposase